MPLGLRPGRFNIEPFDVQVKRECANVLAACGIDYTMRQTVTREQIRFCLDKGKERILEKFPGSEEAAARIINDFNFKDIPHQALGGKRKRRTMHRKRVNNRSRRNRRVR